MLLPSDASSIRPLNHNESPHFKERNFLANTETVGMPSWLREIGRIMLHEFTHYSTVGPDFLLKFYGCLQRPYRMARHKGLLCFGGTEPEPKAKASLVLHSYAFVPET